MTTTQIRDRSVARFNEVAGKKFDDGVKEHGTVLTEVVTLDDAEQEVIDLWHYIQALKMKGELYEKTDSTCSNPECRGCNCG